MAAPGAGGHAPALIVLDSWRVTIYDWGARKPVNNWAAHRVLMLLARRSPTWAYVIAIFGTALVFAMRYNADNPTRGFFTSLAFLLTVLAAGLLGGWKPAVLATLVCLINERVFFTHPRFSFALPSGYETMRILLFGASGVAIAILCEGLQRAWIRVADRQRQLEREMTERLAVAQERLHLVEQLRQADRRKDEFLATLAHELRNPIAPLSNALELWSFAKESPGQLEELRGMMQRQVRQMTRLIDDLLDVSRISRGKISLRSERVDLRAVVEAASESIKPIVAANNQRLESSLPDGPLVIRGDVTRIAQVVGNVLNNAAKYTPEGGQIAVVVSRQPGNARISIRDTGCGIPHDQLSSIFEMFQQVDQTLDRAQGGLGIGLTLAKRLVELHGGTIDAKSEGPGEGSEFIITLPAQTVEAASEPERRPSKLRRDLPRRKILVVDDLAESALTLARMLRAMGQEVATAHDGYGALALIREYKPEVVFLDIAMPGMNGYEVARRIRASNDIESPLLIALTGYGQDEDRRRAYEAGFDFHLTKPTSLEQLTSVLSRADDTAMAVPS
jgi:signal transduction histidine kinase/CheY-like chemotaxis protein